MDRPAQAIQRFIDAYTEGDADRVVAALAPDGVVSYNGHPTVGADAIRRSLAMAGKFAFTVERTMSEGAVQTVEGEMIPILGGTRKKEGAVPYAGVAELTGSGETMREFRLYYDGNQLERALDTYGFRK